LRCCPRRKQLLNSYKEKEKEEEEEEVEEPVQKYWSCRLYLFFFHYFCPRLMKPWLLIGSNNVNRKKLHRPFDLFSFAEILGWTERPEDLSLRPQHAAHLHWWCASFGDDAYACHDGRPS
jgi:hypothetical protein